MSAAWRRRASWLALVVVVVIGLGVAGSEPAVPPGPGERVNALARTIKCPECPGQSVAESDVPISREIRVDLAERVADGQSDEAIRDYYVSRYGSEVLLTPPRGGLAGLIWVLPVVALILGIAGLVVTFRRWRARGAVVASDEDRAMVQAALRREDSEL